MRLSSSSAYWCPSGSPVSVASVFGFCIPHTVQKEPHFSGSVQVAGMEISSSKLCSPVAGISTPASMTCWHSVQTIFFKPVLPQLASRMITSLRKCFGMISYLLAPHSQVTFLMPVFSQVCALITVISL